MSDMIDKAQETHACDCISRQAAIDVGRDLIIPVDGYHMYNQAINNYCAELTNLPSAEPERKTGRWIRNDNGTYSCSVCQSWIPEEQHYYARYCLYCGADMRGEQDE